MSTNKKLIEKADVAFNYWNANNGLLNPEQANMFIRKLLVQPTLLNSVRRIVMSSPSRKIDKIQFGQRIMRAGVQSGNKITLDENTANQDRFKFENEQIVLNVKETVAEMHLPYEVIEDSIERANIGMMTDTGGMSPSGGIVNTIMDLIAIRAAVDLEELILLGDTTSSDPYLAMFDGYLKICESGKRSGDTGGPTTGQTVDNDGARVSRDLFKRGVMMIPDQYDRQVDMMRYYVSRKNEIEYRDTLAARETMMGDMNNGASMAPVYGCGVQLEKVSLMPHSKALLTMPNNLILGIYRGMTIETDKDISAREYKIVLTMRLDVQVEETEASVVLTNIGDPSG